MNFRSLRNADLSGKVVFLRADLNVPVNNGVVSDFTRIDRVKETIDILVTQRARR